MRGIEEYHQRARNFSYIGYSFVIFPSGRVYEGRGWGIKGAHSATPERPEENYHSHAISFAGDYQDRLPTPASLDACRWLIGEGKRLGYVRADIQPTGGHRDVPGAATACPGRHLYEKIPSLQSDVSAAGDIEEVLLMGVQLVRIPARDGRVFANLYGCLVHVLTREILERSGRSMSEIIDLAPDDPRALLPILDPVAGPTGAHSHQASVTLS